MPEPEVMPTQEEWLERVRRDAHALAGTLSAASEAGVSHMIILPQLVFVFRSMFGEMPPEVMAQLNGMMGGEAE